MGVLDPGLCRAVLAQEYVVSARETIRQGDDGLATLAV